MQGNGREKRSPGVPDLIKLPYLLLTIFLVGLALALFGYARMYQTEDEDFRKAFNDHYGVYAIDLPENLQFAGEVVPVNDRDITERLDREMLINTYWQSQTLIFIKKAGRFFPVIEPILARYKIPSDFKYLALAESGLQNVVSPKNAAGFWQFTPETARQYSLEVNKDVDERYNLEKSTDAACRYLLESYQLYKSWTLAAASYNMGRRSLNKQLERQKANNYYDLLLSEETSRYIMRVLAIKTILENPEKYGFHFRQEDLYPFIPTRDLQVDSAIRNLADFARTEGINYKILKIFNPWLRDTSLPNPVKKMYVICIPKEGYSDFHRNIILPSDTLLEDSGVEEHPKDQ